MSLKTVLTTVVAGSQYLIHPQVLGQIQETIKPDVIIPVTILEPEQLWNHLEGTLKLFEFYDDVFTPEFGNVLIEKPGDNSGIASASAAAGSRQVMRLRNDSVAIGKRDMMDLPAGPYILHGPNVHQAWKIYNDTLDAFSFGVYPEDVTAMDNFQALQLPAEDGSNFTPIPVPSRLYSTVPPAQAPLKGFRFTIPDSMSLKGIPTTFSSVAWQEMHNETAGSTAAFAKRLVDLGAVIVGKTKSSQFGSGQEWVDVASPKNPREDGKQNPAGGATGAAGALAGYEWLKASTGLDAIGQAFQPSAAQGLFALRTTSGALPLDGAEISSPKSESVSIFGRDLPELFSNAVAIVHKSLSSPPITFPKRIIYVTDLTDSNDANNSKHLEFLKAVQDFLGVKASKVSIAKTWASKPPKEAQGKGLQDYMRDAPFLSFCYEFYHQYDEFRKDYQAKFGKEPSTEATVQYQWNLGKGVSKADYDDYQARIAVFQKWFDANIMSTSVDGDTVLVTPYTSKAPQYEAPKPSKINGVTVDLLSPLLGAPHIIAPFAQFPYQSAISKETEYHPIYCTILGPKGSDTTLIKLVDATFQQAQWRTKVDTGRFAFPPAQNDRKVDDKPVKPAPATLEEARKQLNM